MEVSDLSAHCLLLGINRRLFRFSARRGVASGTRAREGYEMEAPGALGAFPEARFIWDKLQEVMDVACDNPGYSVPLDDFRRFLRPKAS